MFWVVISLYELVQGSGQKKMAGVGAFAAKSILFREDSRLFIIVFVQFTGYLWEHKIQQLVLPYIFDKTSLNGKIYEGIVDSL